MDYDFVRNIIPFVKTILKYYNGEGYSAKLELLEIKTLNKFLTSYSGVLTVKKSEHSKVINIYGGIWCDK